MTRSKNAHQIRAAVFSAQLMGFVLGGIVGFAVFLLLCWFAEPVDGPVGEPQWTWLASAIAAPFLGGLVGAFWFGRPVRRHLDPSRRPR
ncbi:MAG: hypothetical protein NXI31_22245 [bacterium]|nr:hypothetical protein [bacterium]